MVKGKMKGSKKGLSVARVVGFLIVGLFVGASISAAADKFPVKPVTIVVPYAAGGSTDLNARFLAQFLPKYLGQSVVIDNKPGPGGVEGGLAVAKASPDGYTLLANTMSLLVAYYSVTGAPGPNQFEPVARVYGYPLILGVSEKTGFKTVQDFVSFCKKNPGKLLLGINPATENQVNSETVRRTLGVEVNFIPYKGGAERNVALAGGHLDANVDSLAAFRTYIEAKKIYPLAIAAPKRIEWAKDIPTFAEQGVNLTLYVQAGYWASKGTPADILQILETAIEKTSKDKGFIELMEKNVIDGTFQNRADFAKFIAKEEVRIKKVSQDIGLYKPPAK